jgi:hypothetical protein
MRSLLAGPLAIVVLAAAGCGLPPEPLTIEGNLFTADNRSGEAWTDVNVWLNYYYRVTTSSIPAGGRFQAPLDAFVESRGARFDFRRAQIRDLRLKARLPDGTPIEIVKRFEPTGLERLGVRP